jgi:hypothetical protein
MALSIFEDKSVTPTAAMVKEAIGKRYEEWESIVDFVKKLYKEAEEVWNYSGKNYGWGFRLKDSKRVIVYLTPGANSFKFSLVYGKDATEEALASKVSQKIKDIIMDAKVYAEGRGIRIEVADEALLPDLLTLVEIKLKH